MAPSAISTIINNSSTSDASNTNATKPTTPILPLEAGLLKKFEAPLADVPGIARAFEVIYHSLALTASNQFLPTPIRALPTGEEKGRFLALDLGGTNLRVAVVRLYGGDGLKVCTQRSWSIPEHFKSGAAEVLFRWVADRIGDVVGEYLGDVGSEERERILSEGMELGITFSFPMEQTTHDSALLMPMGKGFTFTTTNDLSSLLKMAYDDLLSTTTPAHPLPKLDIVSITNDSISTLLSAAYLHHSTENTRAAAGIIAGTGTNATCLCPVSKLPASKQPTSGPSTGAILVNTEWSIRGTAPPLKPYTTTWDVQLDLENEKPGFQPFEEMVGGRYLGELVRLVCLDLFSNVPKSQLPEKMKLRYGLDTRLCSAVEASVNDDEALSLLQDYFDPDTSSTSSTATATTTTTGEDPEGWKWDPPSAASFRRISTAVSTRAAALVAAATIGVLGVNDELKRHAEKEVLVCYTGTVLEKYPTFRERCEGFMMEVVERWVVEGRIPPAPSGKRRAVRLAEAKDGGIVGAAVLAGMVKEGRT
ncbi:actin-like ATPase domain-containing protein [Tuber magnatum]|uniref:Phosphotransferase n=1 Tax=Tuber magnatum TaxID=42249 RepID=A0A317STI5_9PEZI|nr:actin-like ATPase domain-containing protein [Tuber magnatum]